MAEKHLLREPHKTKDERVWWYEENAGISVLVQCHGPYNVTMGVPMIEVTIPWRSIRAALGRKDT